MIEIQQTTLETARPDEIEKDLFIAQYQSLRSEIHQRLDQRQQVLTYNLVGAASFFSIGVQPGISGVTVLCYPILSFFLACTWRQHDSRIGQINTYLQETEDRHLEQLGPGWESYRRSLWKKGRKRLSDFVSLPARGIFIGSQLLALIIGLARFSTDPRIVTMFILLTIVDIIAMVMTVFVLGSHRSQAVKGEGA